MKRKPIPPTNHLRSAIRKIDEVVWKLYDEQLAANGAYVEAVSRGNKREIVKLYKARFTALGDRAVMLEGKMASKERGGAFRLTEYGGEMETLHAAAKRLRTLMEAAYLRQKRFSEGVLEERTDKRPSTSGVGSPTASGRLGAGTAKRYQQRHCRASSMVRCA